MKFRHPRAWVFTVLLLSTCTVSKGQSTATQGSSDLAGPAVSVQKETTSVPGQDKATTNQADTGKLNLVGDAKPTPATTANGTRSKVGFWSLQALMFGSAIAAAETTHNCIQAGSCTAIPTPFRTRTAMYNAGLPLAAGVAILSYEMRKHRTRWWFLPSTIVIAGDSLLAVHSARASH